MSSSGQHDPSVLDALDMCGLSVSANGDWHSESGVRAKRIDNTATALVAHAKSIGFGYEPINGVIDGLLCWGQTVIVVDWKSEGGVLTPAQQRMVARGFPIRFIQRPEQLNALKAELLRIV